MRLTIVAWWLAAGPLAAQDLPAPPTPPATQRLTLAEAVRLAADSNAAARLAAVAVQQADARVAQARAALLPGVTADAAWLNRTFNRRSLGFDIPTPPGGSAPPDLIGPFDNVDARLRFTQPLIDRASGLRLSAGRAAARAATADAAATREVTARAAASAYLAAVRADALAAARVADSTLAAELLALVHAQRAAGVSPRIDVTRAEARLAIAAGALVVARARRAQTQIALARVLGLPPALPLALSDSLSPALGDAGGPPDLAAALSGARGDRPELQAEAARVAAARGAAAAIGAEAWPRLEVAADLGANGPAPDELLATRQVTVRVTLPLFDGWRRAARRREQEAAATAATIQEREAADRIAAEVATAWLERDAAAALAGTAAGRLRLALAEVTDARARFAAGTAGHLEVITAQLSLSEARDAEIDARYHVAVARIALAHALGHARELR